MTGDEKPVGVAVLGLGNVGSEVVRIIEESADDLAARIGAPLVLRGVGVRRVAADRGVPVDMLTDDIDELVSRDDVDIVVEVMGPVEPARKAILAALENGKSVVTANKAARALAARSSGRSCRRARSPPPTCRARPVGRRYAPRRPTTTGSVRSSSLMSLHSDQSVT